MAKKIVKHEWIDFSGRLGQMFKNDEKVEIPMYSYERPAYILWGAIANALMERGWTEKQAIDWLQSKATRWALDMDLGDALQALGKQYAQTAEMP